ncbi:MAG: hypothetical protein ACK56F_08435 [bacterium]
MFVPNGQEDSCRGSSFMQFKVKFHFQRTASSMDQKACTASRMIHGSYPPAHWVPTN